MTRNIPVKKPERWRNVDYVDELSRNIYSLSGVFAAVFKQNKNSLSENNY